MDLIFIDLDAYNSRFIEVIPFNDNIMLSLKGMWICSHIRTQLLDILDVRSFHVECVVLMSRKHK